MKMTSRQSVIFRIASISLLFVLIFGACGGSDQKDKPKEKSDKTTTSKKSVKTIPQSENKSASVAPCDRVTPEELSSILGVTTPKGSEVTTQRCFYDTGAPHNVQVAIQINQEPSGGQAMCLKIFGQDGEPFTVGGQPGFWDGVQAVKVCAKNESVLVQVTPGGAKDRDAILKIAELAVNQ